MIPKSDSAGIADNAVQYFDTTAQTYLPAGLQPASPGYRALQKAVTNMKRSGRAITPGLALFVVLCIGGQAFAQNGNNPSGQPEAGQIPPHPPRLPEGVIPAFPGAWGAGMFTTGGRGGNTIAVTNLNDNGDGSLRAALETKGPRIVVFRVAGTIKLAADLNINHPDITIAGQSAPGDGICVAGTLNINTHNVIIRHLRVRRGVPTGGQGDDNIGGNPHHHIIIDHCSTSWGMDENISLYRHMRPSLDGKTQIKDPAENITVQWTISSEALDAKGHAFGGTWGGNPSTFHHNLFASNTARNPSIGMSGPFDFRYNVVFNWRHRSIDGGDETSMVNLINNYFKPGPATNDNIRDVFARIEQRSMYSPGSAWAEGGWYTKAAVRPGKWYVAGNIMHGNQEVINKNWAGMRGPENLARVNTPFEGWPVSPHQTAGVVFEAVLAKAGATLPKRDAVDTRVTNMVRTGTPATATGIIKDVSEVGGYPNLSFNPGQVPADSDGDGMPDDWEIKNKLNSKEFKDAALDTDGDGYTNIEEFLNGTNPQEKINYRNLGNNIDSIS
ncbi:MAG: polysaccharide lyase [Bacteroidota bacterium]